MKRILLLVIFCCAFTVVNAQQNILSTNPTALSVMQGNYNPSDYSASTVIDDPITIINGINNNVNPDSLHALLDVLQTFKNRNTLSDTTSQTEGIGAARRWVYRKFQEYSTIADNRLLPSYLQFEDNVTRCAVSAQMRNIFAVLPGSDLSDKSIIIIEGHIDSRCEDVCDGNCIAEGMEDNASGTALVMELARVMSQYTFKRTMVFLVTIGEEQGLIGANAFAQYAKQENISIRSVLNNDVVGGILCGQTASQPGCMGAGTIDSTNLRLFSHGGFNSPHKQFARFVKLEYKENLLPTASVPMTINIMTPIDRSGRGGDHIPFSNENFTAIRFCAANEHGNADVSNPNYNDRQHTSDDILGIDTDNDNIIDSFFVNFNYLSRMSVINGNAATVAASGPMTPDFYVLSEDNGIKVFITTQKQYQHYRVAVRGSSNDWDSVYTFKGSDYQLIPLPKTSFNYFVSVASVDNNNMESIFSEEKIIRVTVEDVAKPIYKAHLLQNKPNPFDGETIISVFADESMSTSNAEIVVTDINGKVVKRMPIGLKKGINEVTYEHGYNAIGTYIYTLNIDGKTIESKRMIFAN